MPPKKMLLIVCDGLSDRPSKEFGMKTPLQVAKKPAMDALAKHGLNGTMDVIGHGVIPGSDTAHLALFGYDPYKLYTGRGPIEAAGAGLDIVKGDVAFRCNFATVNKSMRVTDRRAGRIKVGTHALAQALDRIKIKDVEIRFREGSEHRAVLVLHGPGLDSRVSDVDPHHEAKILRAKPLVPEAKKTADIVNEFVKLSYKKLSAHKVNKTRRKRKLPPANIVLPRGAGSVNALPSMYQKYGLKCAAVAGVTLVKGICRLVGMDVIDVPGATGGMDTDCNAKAVMALAQLQTHDFVFVNVKAGDIAGHDGDFQMKVRVVEKIDAMLNIILQDIPEDSVVALTCDHSTPVSVKEHSADPVPLTISGGGARFDGITKFDEISSAGGALGRIRGMDLMPIMMGMADRAKKFGS